jgi:hypothetical protein
MYASRPFLTLGSKLFYFFDKYISNVPLSSHDVVGH